MHGSGRMPGYARWLTTFVRRSLPWVLPFRKFSICIQRRYTLRCDNFLATPLCLSTGKPPSYRVMVQAQKAGRQHCSGPSYDSVIRRARTDWLVETLLT